MRRKVLIAAILIAIVFLFFITKRGDNKAVSPQAAASNIHVPAATLTPTPMLPVFDQGSNLKAETEKLIPEDFSGEFKTLKEEAGKL